MPPTDNCPLTVAEPLTFKSVKFVFTIVIAVPTTKSVLATPVNEDPSPEKLVAVTTPEFPSKSIVCFTSVSYTHLTLPTICSV